MENNMYRHILVAVDGSKIAYQALEHAIRLAKLTHAKIFAIYVVDYPSTFYESEIFSMELFHTEIVNEAKTVLDKVKSHLERSGIPSEVRIIDSGSVGKSIAAEIEDTVRALKIDLVVMGTHGRRGFQRLMLGSVAEAFIRRASVPVLLIPTHSH
jgi:nucleotide-binding universal stress UspA family protein